MEEQRRVKYPRTLHLPWSPGRSSDDKMHSDQSISDMFGGRQVIITEKMDGENCTIYSDGYCHARSVDSRGHVSRDRVKALASELRQDIPDGWRLCGENIFARHSISYDSLPAHFLLFGIWDEHNICQSWADTAIWAHLLGVQTVPVLYSGIWDGTAVRGWTAKDPRIPSDYATDRGVGAEGYVVRLSDPYTYDNFRTSVAKYVREGHVDPDAKHWMYQKVVQNKLG